MKILFVDDNIINIKVTKKQLEKIGHKVETEMEPLKVLQRDDLEDFDVFILDISMPKMDGFELRQSLERHQDVRPEVGFVAYTAHASDTEESIFQDDGFHELIIKPGSDSELRQAVHSAYAAEKCKDCLKTIHGGEGKYHTPEGTTCVDCYRPNEKPIGEWR
jgi:CheY-like chemotaxis protein